MRTKQVGWSFVLGLSCLFLGTAQAAGRFELTSSDLKGKALANIPETHVFNSFGCSGQNESPALTWKNAPQGTQSFALTMYDPDAPTGSGWWHWVVVNIPKSATELPAGAGTTGSGLPEGSLQTRTDFGATGYGGPCPPPGRPHRYIFTLYALKVPKLDVDANAPAAMVGYNIMANSLGKAQLNARYGRKK